jgi:hypothetical protein
MSVPTVVIRAEAQAWALDPAGYRPLRPADRTGPEAPTDHLRPKGPSNPLTAVEAQPPLSSNISRVRRSSASPTPSGDSTRSGVPRLSSYLASPSASGPSISTMVASGAVRVVGADRRAGPAAVPGPRAAGGGTSRRAGTHRSRCIGRSSAGSSGSVPPRAWVPFLWARSSGPADQHWPPNNLSNRCGAWLTADWGTPSRFAARDTLRSTMTVSKVTRRFRSTDLRFIVDHLV